MGRKRKLARMMIGYPSKEYLAAKQHRLERREDRRAQERELELLAEQNALLREMLDELSEVEYPDTD